MSHIVVGERIIGQAPYIVNHIVVGAGHFIEQNGGLVQEFAQNVAAIPVIAQRNLPDFSNALAVETWQWETFQHNYGSNVIYGSMLASSNIESSAYEKFREHPIGNHVIELGKETVLMSGSLAAGDLQGAVEHGAKAAETYWDGICRDFGFRGGWGIERIGTMDLPGEK